MNITIPSIAAVSAAIDPGTGRQSRPRGEQGAQQAVMEFGVEDRESESIAGEPVAILARDPGIEAVAAILR